MGFLEVGSVVIVAPASPTEFKRKQHAQAQKYQRDRMKAALDRMAQIMEVGGMNAGTGGTKVWGGAPICFLEPPTQRTWTNSEIFV
jgi:hypothetical protein